MTTIILCKHCNFYTMTLKKYDQHAEKNNHNALLIIHTNTNLPNEVLTK